MKKMGKWMLLAAMAALLAPAAAQAKTYGAPIPLRGSVEVSSELDSAKYGKKMIADLNAATAWNEGVEGLGEGETITWTYKEEKWIYGMAILPGYQKNKDIYNKNGVPIELLLEVGGKVMRCELDTYEPDFSNPTASMRYVDFPEPVLADEVTVTIETVREGSKYEDTCISELFFYEYATDPDEAAAAKPRIICDPDAVNNQGTQSARTGTYIFPDSNSRYLSASELTDLSNQELRIARNEIFARRGYIFGNKELKNYFESQSWYRASVRASDFDPVKMFNRYEMANVGLIVEEEESRQYDSSSTLILLDGDEENEWDEWDEDWEEEEWFENWDENWEEDWDEDLDDLDDDMDDDFEDLDDMDDDIDWNGLAEGSGDVYDCLDPDDYVTVTSEDGSFSFAYPPELFNEALIDEEGDVYNYYFWDDFHEMEYGLFVSKYEDSGKPLKKVKAIFNENLDFFESTFMEHISEKVDSKGFAHALLGGYLDKAIGEGSYRIFANDGDSTYVLEFQYYDPEPDGVFLPINYVVDTLYRYCSFSGSTYRPRTYKQFCNDDMGKKK